MWWWVHTNAAVDKLLRLGERHLHLSALHTYVEYSHPTNMWAFQATLHVLPLPEPLHRENPPMRSHLSLHHGAVAAFSTSRPRISSRLTLLPLSRRV
jgi:hypothetical protein